MLGLLYDFEVVQKLNSIYGALVMPMVALVLLLLNSRTDWVGAAYRNRPMTVVVLAGILIFFAWTGGPALVQVVGAWFR